MKKNILKSIFILLAILCAGVLSTFCVLEYKGINYKFWQKGHGDVEIVPISFAVDSWETIVANPDFYNVGDEKTITSNTGEQISFVIIGKNHDTISGTTDKASLSIGMKDLLSTTYAMNETSTNEGGWGYSLIRNSTLPMIFETLPSDLKSVIKTVDKLTANGGKQEGVSVTKTRDKLWLFSESELLGFNHYGHVEGGEQYAYFNDNNWQAEPTMEIEKRVKMISNISDSATGWWLRSPMMTTTKNFCFISQKGVVGNYSANNLRGVCFGFAV